MHGINNLRVIDASIMPVITRGHTNVPTMMIAEKGSDLIKEDLGFLPKQMPARDNETFMNLRS